MSDIERGRMQQDEDRLPWLEAVEDEDDERGVGIGKLIGAVLVLVVAIAVVVGGLMWLRSRPDTSVTGEGALIEAPEGAYKVKPTDPGGMRVEGEGESAYAASEGQEMNGAIDIAALPEAPLTGVGRPTAVDTVALPPSSAAPAAAPAAASTPAAGAPAPVAAPERTVIATPKAAAPRAMPGPAVVSEPVATETAGGGTVQLGAFSSEAKANAAWSALSKRFAVLAPLTKSVLPVKTDSGTLYRLRVAAGGQAGTICARLKVAGESCAVVG